MGQCDDSKFINNSNSHKLSKQFPYKFLFQSKRLFEQIYRNKFIRLFDSSARKQGAQCKLSEIHTYDLDIFEYTKNELDLLLTKQFAMKPKSIQNNESSRSLFTASFGSSSLDQTNTYRRQQTVEKYFIHSFDTQNLVEFADTILEDDYGVMFETRIINILNKILNIINPNVVYSKLSSTEINAK